MGQQESQLKPRAVEDLMRMTNFTDKELQEWYHEFKKDADDGKLSKKQFIRIFESIFPGSDGNEFATHVFRTFDVNKDGEIIQWRWVWDSMSYWRSVEAVREPPLITGVLNFREFVIGLSLSLRGSFDEKLYWAFNIYDVDGNGFISQSEMKEIITAMCAICRDKNFHDVIDDDFFVRLDKDNDGQVSWAEFRKGVYENKTMTQFLLRVLGCATSE